MNEVLKEKLAMLPDAPGCYLMKDAGGQIIYVGKALSLKNRVRSYFRGSHDPKTELLVPNIADFDTVVVSSEAEALILESNLIKEYKPHFNILMRDDKHYPYLKLTLSEEYPRLLVVRRAAQDGNRYFGPYPNAGAMHQAVDKIRQIFPLRTCKTPALRNGQRACLNAHIGRCKAPCEGKISKQDYAKMVEGVSLFLQGKTKQLIHQEEAAMAAAAAELHFEDAARSRDLIAILQQTQIRQSMDTGTGHGDYDLIAVAAGEDVGVVQVFFMREGNVVGRKHFFLTNAEPGLEPLLLERFIQEYYGGGESLPSHLYCSLLPEESAMLEQMLSAQCRHKVEISVPQRGDKRRLMGLVQENANIVLENHLQSVLRREERSAAGLEALRQSLALPHSPARIECYDISHVQGTHMVGSMTVFLNGVPAPKQYRKFKIKTLEGSNDFAALQEVLERRFRHGLADRAAGKTDGFAQFPDLIVIDGGKGQLSAVLERLTEMDLSLPSIISLAKREEEVFVPGRSLPIQIQSAEGLYLLQQIRDEAHRFAITFHRSLRGKAQTKSLLNDIPGIGEKRRQSLLKAFGSLKNISQAALSELAAAPGMNQAVAETLYQHLHPEENDPAAEAALQPGAEEAH